VNVDRLLSVQRASFEAATSSVRGSWPEADALGRDELAALIERNRYCVLATVARMPRLQRLRAPRLGGTLDH
jgi:hypothetical protein